VIGPAVHAQQGPPERDYWPTAGWRLASPESQGMDAALLESAGARIQQEDTTIDSLLVVRHGYLVAEFYAHGYDGQQPHPVASVTKSVVSALVGIAIAQGLLPGVDTSLAELFPEYVRPEVNPWVQAITVEDLLTMQSGLLWNSEGPSADFVYNSPDWVRATLSLPPVAEPGTYWVYNSAGAHVLSALVTRWAGQTTAEFAEQVLFGPLGITDYLWETDPLGIPNGGSGLALTPRDMAKIGYLYLNLGTWDGATIVPAEWVAASTRLQVNESGSQAVRYGYLWWIPALGGEGAFAASGYGGQAIYVSPALDLVMVLTGDVERVGELPDIVGEYVVPAVLDAPAGPDADE
jgi:CubicO group peptidase (beta-lactamase class C family)